VSSATRYAMELSEQARVGTLEERMDALSAGS
jgi:hypothetical protein